MTMNPLPPQAYTKETLLKAYQWLMSQNSGIKEIATTPDMLVSLYLKATRDGDSALERPSIQNFKKELRSLVGMMGDLDRPQAHSSPSPPPQSATPPAQQAPVQAPTMAAPQHQAPVQQPMPSYQMPLAASTPQAVETTPAVMQNHPPQTHSHVERFENTISQRGPQEVMEFFDLNTKNMIREVKNDFNLSNDYEAVRMLIKVGYIKSKNMLK